MGYYMGDFYGIGGMGDPGFFSMLRRVAGPAISMVPVPGAGIVGRAVSAIRKVKESHAYGVVRAGVGKFAGMVKQHPALSAAGAAGVIATGAGAVTMARRGSRAAAGMAGPMAGAGGGFGGARKRMNVCNPRALRRAIRRTHGFAKLAMKTIHLVHPTKHARFGGFKRVKHAPRRKRRA